jgi:hypothetical protein
VDQGGATGEQVNGGHAHHTEQGAHQGAGKHVPTKMLHVGQERAVLLGRVLVEVEVGGGALQICRANYKL